MSPQEIGHHRLRPHGGADATDWLRLSRASTPRSAMNASGQSEPSFDSPSLLPRARQGKLLRSCTSVKASLVGPSGARRGCRRRARTARWRSSRSWALMLDSSAASRSRRRRHAVAGDGVRSPGGSFVNISTLLKQRQFPRLDLERVLCMGNRYFAILSAQNTGSGYYFCQGRCGIGGSKTNDQCTIHRHLINRFPRIGTNCQRFPEKIEKQMKSRGFQEPEIRKAHWSPGRELLLRTRNLLGFVLLQSRQLAFCLALIDHCSRLTANCHPSVYVKARTDPNWFCLHPGRAWSLSGLISSIEGFFIDLIGSGHGDCAP